MFHMHVLLSLAILIASSNVSGSPYCGLIPPNDHVPRQTQSGANSSNASDQVLVTAWYPGWLGNQFPPSNISWAKYSAMTLAFAVTTPDTSVISLDSVSEQVLPNFVTAAKNNGVSPLLSIGGWTGSQYFSTAVATPENRTTFVKSVVGLASKYQLDGIDFDWEYPNHQGVGCNTISSNDSANFLAFLQELRQDPTGGKLTLSAAVGLAPFTDSNGSPMKDVAQFAQVLDHIAIMAYDIWGSFSTTGVGPNAPLNDSCAPNKAGSVASAVQAWTAANFPANKIALGVPAYGHSFHVNESVAVDSSGNLAAYPPFDKSQQPHGDSEDGNGGVDQCGAQVPIGGIFNFWGLIDGGFLNTNGTAAVGIDYRFDNCSQTPYVYNSTSQVMISYDDATSFAAKGRFVDEQGLMGFSIWHALGDYNDILIDSISSAMGITQECS